MNRLLVGFFVAALFLASCAAATDTKTITVTIDGTWTLATVQGASAASMPNTSGTLTVTGANAFTKSTIVNGTNLGTGTGTVALKAGSVYTFTPTAGGGGTDYTLSSDGKSLSGSDPLLGAHSYTK